MSIRKILYTIILLIIIFIIIFIIPTSNMIGRIVREISQINNIYFENLIKILIFLITYFIISRYQYRGITKDDIIQFIFKNISLCIGIFLIIFEIILTFIFRYQDVHGYINISSDAWISYIFNVSSISITAFGILIGLNQYINEKEAKERPKIFIKLVEDIRIVKYGVEINKEYKNKEENNFRYICVRLINKSENNIYEPRIQDDNFYFYGPIYIERIDGVCGFLDEIDTRNNDNDNEGEVIQLKLNIEAGMHPERYFNFYLFYECNNKLYRNKIKIILDKFDEKKIQIKVGDTQKIYFRRKKYDKK